MGDIMEFVKKFKEEVKKREAETKARKGLKEFKIAERRRKGEERRIRLEERTLKLAELRGKAEQKREQQRLKKLIEKDISTIEAERAAERRAVKKGFKRAEKIILQKDIKGRPRTITGIKKIARVVAGKRPYTKTSKWYRRRTTREGEFKSPSEFARKGIQRYEGGKFTVGGFRERRKSIAELDMVGPTETFRLKSPLFGEEGNSIALRGDLLDIKSFKGKEEKKKREIKWF